MVSDARVLAVSLLLSSLEHDLSAPCVDVLGVQLQRFVELPGGSLGVPALQHRLPYEANPLVEVTSKGSIYWGFCARIRTTGTVG